ncbi:MAG: acyl-CoA dehydratase activase [Bacillota bacterium]
MIVAGCDIGSLTAKAVIMADRKIIAEEVIRAAAPPERSADEVMERALSIAGLTLNDIDFCVGTGYGRKRIPFANAIESEIACHGKGAIWRDPLVRTVIDIGGQDSKVIRIDGSGTVERYVYNDKCASGTGRFLEIMADALGVRLEEMGIISLQSSSPVAISSQCVVFAETEIISLVNEGIDMPDIVGGLHIALAKRVAGLAGSIGVERKVAMSGGVAQNPGILKAMESALGYSVKKLDNPQVNGALGAAVLAMETLQSG